MNLLNLGCGPDQWDGPWVNVDRDYRWRRVGGPRFVLADPLTCLPFADGYFDGAVAHHVLMHVPQHRAEDWLAELRRVVSGPVRISVPDALGAFNAYVRGDHGWFPLDGEGRSMSWLLATYLTQNGQTRSLWTPSLLTETMAAAGFDRVAFVGPGQSTYGSRDNPVVRELVARDNRPGESLIVEGWAP